MTHRMRAGLLAALLSTAAFAAAQPAEPVKPTKPEAPAPRVELFNPQGTVRQVRQVTARFTTPMVALGDPWLEDPFDVNCPVSGKGRWADGRNWVYDFEADLPAGLECRFTIRAGAKALDGRALEGRKTFSFNTGGPAIIASFPREGWRAVDEEQIFLLKLDAPATIESIERHAYCVVEGVAERVPLRVLTDEARSDVLAQRTSLGYAYYELLWKSGRQTQARVRDRTLEQAEETIVVATCARRLPAAKQVKIVWGAGVAAASGLATQKDQQLTFVVRPAFTAEVTCSRVNAESGCIPFSPITVRLSAPVPRTQAARFFLRDEHGKEYRPAKAADANAPTAEEVTFNGPFPDSGKLTVHLPSDLTDDAGRPLSNAARFPLELEVDAYPPLAKFSGTFGILELHEGGVLPVTLRNVEPALPARQAHIPGRVFNAGSNPVVIAEWLRRVEAANARSGDWIRDAKTGAMQWRETTGSQSVFANSENTKRFELQKPSGPRPAEVVGIPLKEPGFYVVELESRILGEALLGQERTRFVSTAALVTNMAVHFLWGNESSAVWVTQLSDGSPVAGAEVDVRDYCNGDQVWSGRTDSNGLAKIDRTLGTVHESDYCGSPTRFRPLLATARRGEDFSFAISSWSQGISPGDFGISRSWDGPDLRHTVLDRSLFRAGETVSMKHFLRRHTMQGFETEPFVPGKRKVVIRHEGSDQRYEAEVAFDANGVGEQTWNIPKDARLGDYVITIADAPDPARSDPEQWRPERISARFKVEEFRLPSMRATVQGPARPLVNPESATVDLHVSYLAGGGASGLPVTVRSVVEPRRQTFADYADFQFGGAPVVEGLREASGAWWDYDFDPEQPAGAAPRARVMPLTLDAEGSARVTIPDLPKLDGPAQLIAELEYADANGELLTSVGRVQLVPAELSVGIRRDGWIATEDQLRFRVVVLDLDGKPVPRQRVEVSLYSETAYSYRKRLIGGFYAYETLRETKKLPRICKGTTDARGLLLCEVAPGASGQIVMRAQTRDARGNVAGATSSIWVAGKDDWWFGGTTGDRMDVLPEEKEYQPGQVARFQVRMPFRSATALVSVEREGVMESFVTKLSGRSPVVKVPIAGHHAPNIYVSVLAVRGRVASSGRTRAQRAAQGEDITALVDLNKPAYRLGIAQVKVGWKAHRLDVRVTPEKPTYRVRERAQVKVKVTRADGQPLPAGTEFALAAIDEALLELASNDTWKLLEAMMGERSLDVVTATAQMQVVGKRHYGRKAVPTGGGGGRERARELFDSLLVWKPRVQLDANGEAMVEVPLNESLTSFRIVAVAHGGTGHFGTGSTSITTTQDLILLSGLPPLVREGDRYLATFTVRNTTDRALRVQLSAESTPAQPQPLQPREVEIAPGQARDVSWEVVAPIGASGMKWSVSARAAGTNASDRLAVTQKVIPAHPVRTYQATILQLTNPQSIPVERPPQAIPGRGGVEIGLRERLGGSLDGVREYMSSYSYVCLEQRLSRAVALRNEALWNSVAAELPAYMDRDGLLRYFPSLVYDGDDTLTSYVLAIAHEAGWQIPEDSRQRMLMGLKGFAEGRIIRRSALPTADLTIRKLSAIEALSRYGEATPNLLQTFTEEPNLWPTSAVLDWLGILKRVPGIPRASERQQTAEGILRARLNFQGTTMGFSTSRSDALWWLMISEDSNAVRMLLSVLDSPSWREDIPRLVRGALGRQQRGHWNTTVANAWGVLAFEKFSAAFESTPVTGETVVRRGTDRRSVKWPQPDGASEQSLEWGTSKAPLELSHSGTGKPWVTVRATAAWPLEEPVSTGFRIQRTVTPVSQQVPGRWTRGDVARVRLDLEAQSDMSWVVVDDPVPGGASLLGSGLGGQSQILQRGEERTGPVWPAYEERRFDAFRAYYRFVPKGKWTVEYTVRFNNPGTFQLPATRVEAMYAPEMLGELPNAALVVEPAP